MKIAIVVGKLGVLALWAWGIFAFISPSSVPYPQIGQMAVLGLAAVHVGEVFAFAKKLAAKGGSLAGHAAQVFVFGYLHVLGTEHGS